MYTVGHFGNSCLSPATAILSSNILTLPQNPLTSEEIKKQVFCGAQPKCTGLEINSVISSSLDSELLVHDLV